MMGDAASIPPSFPYLPRCGWAGKTGKTARVSAGYNDRNRGCAGDESVGSAAGYSIYFGSKRFRFPAESVAPF